MLTLATMLRAVGWDDGPVTKLVRHQDSRLDLAAVLSAGHFETYQAIQSRPVFAASSRIVSFLGRPGTHAVLHGVYRLKGVTGLVKRPTLDEFPYPPPWPETVHRYDLERDPRYAELEGRLVINWGTGTRSWVQNFNDGAKPVVELLPEGYVREFPGFLDVVLTFDELVKIVRHPVAHRAWHLMLRSVAGVYLILDTKTGTQYVGSAYGSEGLLGRWRSYTQSRHGDNVQLQALIAQRPGGPADFQFSILQTLPITMTANEVIGFEALHKRKLGSRAHGLNSN